MLEGDRISNGRTLDENNLMEQTMNGSVSNSSQNFSLPSSSSSVVADSTNDHDNVQKLDCFHSNASSSANLNLSNNETESKSRRAPDMQLGRCKWIRVYDNVTYIVAGIIIRQTASESREILLIQEAKKKCYGKWYIPAGHVEPGETIEQACKRQVVEETGFMCDVDQLICMETRGSGWYRMSFACTITGGTLKTTPDRESLSAGWHNINELRKRPSESSIHLRCRDCLQIVNEAVSYWDWRQNNIPPQILEDESINEVDEKHQIERLKFAPILNRNESQPGLFIEFVIIKKNLTTDKMECLVHGSVRDESQLLLENSDGFPIVEFGFEFFFPMVVSKCYRHIFEDGHQAIDVPEAVLAMWCLPAPVESLRQGLRLRILCRHKRSISRAPLCVPQRYHWINLEDERVLAALHLLPNQYRPPLIML